jgi:hypothetical protein
MWITYVDNVDTVYHTRPEEARGLPVNFKNELQKS